jgi:hypothetical protein
MIMRKFQNIVMMFALILVVGLSACKEFQPSNPGGSTVPVPKGMVSLSHDKVQQTPKGARVESAKGLSDNQLNLIDAGLTQAFADGKASGWADDGVAYNYARYTIYIPADACVLSPESKTPSFLVRGDNYDGSVYDKYNSKGELPADQQNDFKKFVPDGIGVIYAAELLVDLNTEGSLKNGQQAVNASFVVCPDESVLQNGAEYGAEHAITARYDTDYFLLTQTHSTIGHPILPKRQMSRGSSAKPKGGATMQSPIILGTK